MFTGLVQGIGQVLAVRAHEGDAGGVRLTIQPRWDVHVSILEAGESISVSGACLTLASDPRNPGALEFDAIPETLLRTTLGSLRPGARVNLERSLRASDLMGGHAVQGHVDGTGIVEQVRAGSDWRVWIRPETREAADAHDPSEGDFMRSVVPKGSICVDGVSLTVAGVTGSPPHVFHVALIPTTLTRTTLADLNPGDRVNLESDATVRTIVHYLRHYARDRGDGRAEARP
jgi:riboflavin synthase